MEETVKEPTSATAKAGSTGKPTSRLLRYPLRSATKPREEKPPLTDASNSSASRARVRTTSNVSKSVSVLDVSSKEKSAKPPRRMSIPTKPSASPAPNKIIGNITPISETRAKRSTTNSVKSDTPTSDVSKSTARRNFNRLSSAPYWVSQIKLSESTAKHSISLGFFSLALEAECEPLQLLRDELQSYVRRHNLAEFGESLKQLFERYNISEMLDQLQVSETCTFVPEDENRSSDDDVRSSSSITIVQEQKLKTSSICSTEVYQVKDMNNEKTKENYRITGATDTEVYEVKDINTEKTEKNSSSIGATDTEVYQVKDMNTEKTEKNSSSIGTTEVYKVKDVKKEAGKKTDSATTKTRRSTRTNAANPTSGLQSGGGNTQKKPQKPKKKQESNKAVDKLKKQGKKSSDEEGPIEAPAAEKSLQENKENMDEALAQAAEIRLVEV
ncbi:hypothetical protein M9H77_04911 [Catharanthus roseus]|uniref:Uncharacterized protein n=1 Tax=Catharanthus roseus TaxID=4058 RepID=A0ACC0CFZ4_CATRO|nr:hypothetical protein M9H77_04911 [Catharanthus roseus]